MISDRTYTAENIAGFMRTAEAYGGLSNMAGGFAFHINSHLVRSTEAFYQAMRFPFAPEIQKNILAETSPMFAKRKAYETLDQTRKDWLDVNLAVMRHALRLKVNAHPERTGAILAQTGDKLIVEISNRDDFWGAKPQGNGVFIGKNVLGRLWMELRLELSAEPDRYTYHVSTPDIADYLFLGEKIKNIEVAARPIAQANFSF